MADELSFDMAVGAAFNVAPILREIEAQRAQAADLDAPIEDRIAAFEDIMESEVGDTTFSRARNIEREVGLRQIYLKFEGSNPSGTQKDRIAFAQVLDALRRGYQIINLATCGNYGMAMSFAASLAGLSCMVYIPRSYHSRRLDEMKKFNAQIVLVDGDYEAAVEQSSREAAEHDHYDANPGGANTDLQLRAYGEIAYEIYDELRDAPAAVGVPVSNGTTLAGIYRGFVSLYRRGKTSRIPRFYAGSSHAKNPIVSAFIKGLQTCEDLSPRLIRESAVNEPLINWHSIDGDQALNAVRESDGWAVNVSDRQMMAYSRLVREQEGMLVLPASTAGLLALIRRHKQEALPNDRFVAILTGRKP